MKETVLLILVTALYFIALINPVSKVSVLAVLSHQYEKTGFTRIAARASLLAAAITLGSMIFGDFLLRTVFRVELHSLRLAGGAVLCWVGFNALRRGIFFEQETQTQFESIALVPLACPMIAGPATIAACIATSSREGLIIPGIAILIAIAVNHLVMIFSRQISKALGKLNLMGAIIRLTGLVVMTIGIQMVLDGIAAWQGGRLP